MYCSQEASGVLLGILGENPTQFSLPLPQDIASLPLQDPLFVGSVLQEADKTEAKRFLIRQHYTTKIQLLPGVINDVLDDIVNAGRRVLFFGLGFDSPLWFHANGKQMIWFVEQSEKFIALNWRIPREHVVRYSYQGITVEQSRSMPRQRLEEHPIPKELQANAPYDVIVVDAPWGGQGRTSQRIAPGRLLPIFWASHKLCRNGSIVYVDDVSRRVEHDSIERFMLPYATLLRTYPGRRGPRSQKFLVTTCMADGSMSHGSA